LFTFLIYQAYYKPSAATNADFIRQKIPSKLNLCVHHNQNCFQVSKIKVGSFHITAEPTRPPHLSTSAD